MYCKKCGEKIIEGAKFCGKCGGSFFTEDHPHQTQWTPTPVQKVKNKPKASSIIWTVVILGCIGYTIYANVDQSAIDTNNSALSSFDSGTGNEQQVTQQFQNAANSAVTNDTKIETLKNLAYVYSSDGNDAQALSTFQEALKLADANSYNYYLITGEIDLLEGDPGSALTNYNSAYAIQSDFQINNALNLFYLDLDSKWLSYDNYPKALSYAQKAAQLSNLSAAKQNLAIAYYFNNNYTQAISILLQQPNLDQQPVLYYWIGLSYAGENDTVNAKIYLQKAVDGGIKVPQTVSNYLNSN